MSSLTNPQTTEQTPERAERRSLHVVHLDAAQRVALFRIFFGMIWAIDAWLKWQPSFINGVQADVTDAGQGQPGVLHWWFHLWNQVVAWSPHTFGYATAAVETLIAFGLIFGFARGSIYIFGAVASIGIWGVAEGFGGPYGSGSTDIGAAVMYAVVFLALYGLDTLARRTWTLDERIEQRISWWRAIAEPHWAPKD